MLCDKKDRFLFEVRPDLFPQGWLSELEVALWGKYYEEQNRAAKKGRGR